MAEQQKKSGGSKKIGRNKYRAMNIREKNKLRRVLCSSGAREAGRYAKLHNLTGYLASLTA